ncbi:hypothetical protein J7I98_25935 [Streptomyces sp. ISL-98]|uniref:hypothetical protein n=1 Tax=Streptomyces sp. ISL-98 TaxID=2819192 RepID=UPI001BE5DDC4|nr:hypothetical protein [Streptomyces sp. ISL-98]MBT2509257.1 hypothetical protein [Streptomyces sp. ISL-98]
MAAIEVDDEPFLEAGEHVPGSPSVQAEDEGGVRGDVEAVPDRIFLKGGQERPIVLEHVALESLGVMQGSTDRGRGAPRRRIDFVVPAA